MAQQFLLVSGSRDWTDEEAIRERISLWSPDWTIVAHGDNPRGADAIADRVAREMGYGVLSFPADWKSLGKIAGPVRNQEMVEYAKDMDDRGLDPHLLAFPLPQSRGTIDMIERCELAQFMIHDVRQWVTGTDFSKFKGMQLFTHIIRAYSDPDETYMRGKKAGRDPTSWRQYSKADPKTWMRLIMDHMSDGKSRTFNRICVELTGRTADVLSGKAPDKGLWLAVLDGWIEHTVTAPVLFRRRTS